MTAWLSLAAAIMAAVCSMLAFGTGYDRYNGDHIAWPVIIAHLLSGLLGFFAFRATISYDMSTPMTVPVYNAGLLLLMWLVYGFLHADQPPEWNPELRAFGLYFFPFLSVPGAMLLSHIHQARKG